MGQHLNPLTRPNITRKSILKPATFFPDYYWEEDVRYTVQAFLNADLE